MTFAQSSLDVAPGVVHVWRASLDTPPFPSGSWRSLLAADELERAGRFAFELHRNRFIAGRAQLRLLLSEYLETAPESIRFGYGPQGKPFVVDNDASLQVNVSHSEGLALFAVTRGREVGVDLEHVRPDISPMEIATSYFSAAEVAVLRCLGADEQVPAFYACWTRKEAYLKATGLGMTLPLDSFDVTFLPSQAPTLACRTFVPPQGPEWSVHPLETGTGFAGAVVVSGGPVEIQMWEPIRRPGSSRASAVESRMPEKKHPC